MIRTKKLIASINDVPPTWAFEYYLKLPQKLCGQEVCIRSIFNIKDKTPSFTLYWHKKLGRYQFKDFSSGYGGSQTDLISLMFNIKPSAAMYKIIEDYNEFILNNGDCYEIAEFKEHSKYKVTEFTKRQWNILDREYWMQYSIGSKILEYYNVFPLEKYKLTKEDQELVITGYNIYGFFRKDGSLYKIYQPHVRDKKFIKIKDYIQGTDQLKYEAPILVICSSMKDLMCLINYKWNMEAVAPHSENTLIPEHIIEAYKHKYKLIVTLLDNDEAGIKAMKKYQEKYDIPYAHLEGEKDLSDNIAKYRKEAIKGNTYDLIYNALNTKLQEV